MYGAKFSVKGKSGMYKKAEHAYQQAVMVYVSHLSLGALAQL